ncbi:sushi domain containing 2, partial [Reticulomyxa filosa]
DGSIGCLIFHAGAYNCIRATAPGSFSGQQCCYTIDDNLCTSGRCAGTADYYSPDINALGHIIFDVTPFFLCCFLHSQCDVYLSRRPSNKGPRFPNLLPPPLCSWVQGDAHLITLDGHNYTFNGIGNYYLIKHHRFEMGGQLTKIGCGSMLTAIAIRIIANNSNGEKDVVIEVQSGDGTSGLQVYYNGDLMLLPVQTHLQFADYSIDYNYNSTVIAALNRTVLCNLWLTEMVLNSSQQTIQYLQYSFVAENATYFGELRGLLGNSDGNPFNDFVLPNGTILDYNLTLKQLHYSFGLLWLIPNSSNLFIASNYSLHDIYNWTPSFDINFGCNANGSNISNIANAMCQNQFQCLFDAASVDDVTFANHTYQSVQFSEIALKESRNDYYNVTTTPTPTHTASAANIQSCFFCIVNLFVIACFFPAFF